MVDKPQLRDEPRPIRTSHSTLDVGSVSTVAAYKALGKSKGCGYDKLPAEVLQAGGDALACKYSRIDERLLRNASWPIGWRGGRMQGVYKKGDPMTIDSSRGILLADHSGKAWLAWSRKR